MKTGVNTAKKRPMNLPQYQAPRETGRDSIYSNTPASRSLATERTVLIRMKIGKMAMLSWI